jgi:hypothetical protein
LDILLVGPTGQTVELMSADGTSNLVSAATLVFDDTGGPLPPAIVSGTYVPAGIGPGRGSLPGSAPPAPYGSALAAFNGLNPNGTWSLYISDTAAGDGGQLASGWSLSVTTSGPLCTSCVLATNTPPSISNISVAGGNVMLTWTAIAGKVYRVQTKTDLLAAWVDLAGDVTAAGSSATKVDSSGLATKRFYQVILLP